MKPTLPVLVGLGLFFLGPVLLHAKIERTVDKTFAVQPGGTLKVETAGGGIKVEPGAGDAVKVEVKERIDASTDAEADEILKHLTLTLEQQGNDVTAVARYEGERTSSLFHWGNWPPVQCEFTVTVPAKYNVALKTSGGGISVGDLTGTVEGRTSGGGISLEACSGDVEVHTSGGGIHLGPVGGNAQVFTSGGGISIKGIAGVVKAHTSGGPIDVAFSGPLQGDCEFATSGGGITVHVNPKSDFDLDAHTSGGGVHCDLPVTVVGDVKPSRLAGKVNGGGHLLKLRSSGGGIRVVAE